MRITVLGAGYMGSAITFPLSRAGHEVRLWGTWLDDGLIEACAAGPHPKLGLRLPPGVGLHDSAGLEESLRGAEAVFLAVSSEGFAPVLTRLRPFLRPGVPLVSLTKGFVPMDGAVLRTGEAMRRILEPAGLPPWLPVGGPVKAMELARGVPTASVYGVPDSSFGALVAGFRAPFYRTVCSADAVGVELCATLKNAYAIALGMCDGLFRGRGTGAYDNVKALLLAKSLEEMALIVQAGGGDPRTALGLPGAGDLYVTAQSGRNRKFGELIGSGAPAGRAFQEMLAGGELAEGYHAVLHGWDFIGRLGSGLREEVPVFHMLHRILSLGQDAKAALDSLVRGIE